MQAAVAHHVVPHHGDEALFWKGELISLCKTCHDREAQRIEHGGHRLDVDSNGWPLDPRHPINIKRR